MGDLQIESAALDDAQTHLGVAAVQMEAENVFNGPPDGSCLGAPVVAAALLEAHEVLQAALDAVVTSAHDASQAASTIDAAISTADRAMMREAVQ